jgi:DNA (cytosine-5)-methyltransferase 1
MLTPQFILPLARELVIDLFAGGGGASTGIEAAIGRHVDIAVNHDREAVALHQANHPQTRHYVEDVFAVDPLQVTEGQPVGLLWASPDCKHFSKAKGGKPVSKKIRGLAWVVVKWAKLVRPRIIFLENVEEFQTWGPLGEDNRPCPQRKGRTFRRWVGSLKALGYAVEFREIRADTLGAPTIRNRLYMVARCDGMPIVWPTATHGKGLKPVRTAAECIDWQLPCPSIFLTKEEGAAIGVKRPLAEATMRRIAKGVKRYVIDAAEPFIVPSGYGERAGQQPRTASIRKPLATAVGANKHALVQPTLAPFLTEHANAANQRVMPADEPLRTQMAEVKGGHFALVAPHLTKYHGESAGSGGDEPFPTITANSFHKRPGGNPPLAVVSAFLAQHNNHRGTVPSDGRPVTAGTSTITGKGCQQALVAANMVKLRGTSNAAAADQPLHTVSAQGFHHAEVRAFLTKYYGTDQDPNLREPLHTCTTKDRFGLVTVKGEPYQIVDIGMRMLTPRELYRAQGFPESYHIGHGVDPFTGERIALTKTAQVRMCGNSVCPPVAAALVRANYTEQVAVRELEAA